MAEGLLAMIVNSAIWFALGWYFRGQRAEREKGDVLHTMMGILEAQTAQRDGSPDA